MGSPTTWGIVRRCDGATWTVAGVTSDDHGVVVSMAQRNGQSVPVESVPVVLIDEAAALGVSRV